MTLSKFCCCLMILTICTLGIFASFSPYIMTKDPIRMKGIGCIDEVLDIDSCVVRDHRGGTHLFQPCIIEKKSNDRRIKSFIGTFEKAGGIPKSRRSFGSHFRVDPIFRGKLRVLFANLVDWLANSVYLHPSHCHWFCCSYSPKTVGIFGCSFR